SNRLSAQLIGVEKTDELVEGRYVVDASSVASTGRTVKFVPVAFDDRNGSRMIFRPNKSTAGQQYGAGSAYNPIAPGIESKSFAARIRDVSPDESATNPRTYARPNGIVAITRTTRPMLRICTEEKNRCADTTAAIANPISTNNPKRPYSPGFPRASMTN